MRLFAEFRLDRVSCRGDGYIRTEHDTVPDINIGVIHKGQIEIRIYIVSEMGVASPVCVKRRLDIAVFPHFSKEFPEQLHAQFHLRGTCLVEIIKSVKTLQLFFCNFFIGAEI